LKKLKAKEKNMHKATQKRFFELVTSQAPLYHEVANPINTYKELIHYRFKEVILSTFPRFLELLSEDKIDSLIVDFIKSKPESPYIWQMPNEFRQFLKASNLGKTYPFMDDLLWFEWIEVELFMKDYKPKESESFSWENNYTLSDSALIKELNFPVHYDEGYEEGGIYPLLMFYNFETHDVHFQEITPFLQQFMGLLKEQSTNAALRTICTNYEVDVNGVKELLVETLEGFTASHIFKGKTDG
jgi:hypothetical protein